MDTVAPPGYVMPVHNEGGPQVGRGSATRKKEAAWAHFRNELAADRELLIQKSFPVEVSDWSADFARPCEAMVPGVAVYMYDAPVVRGDRGKRFYAQLQEFSGLAEPFSSRYSLMNM